MKKNVIIKVREREVDLGVILFTSLMLILLSFFIMMNTMATPNEERSRKALGSLFSEFGDTVGLDEGIGSDFRVHLGDHPKIRIAEFQSMVEKTMRDIGIDGDVKVFLRDEDWVLVFPGHLLTHDDPKMIPAKSKLLFKEIVSLLSVTDKKIRVEGHSAGYTPHGVQKYSDIDRENWRDSQLRAQAVANFIMQSGIPEEQLELGAYGATKPVASLEKPQENMRVEIVVVDGMNDARIGFYPFDVRMGHYTFRRILDKNGKAKYIKRGKFVKPELGVQDGET